MTQGPLSGRSAGVLLHPTSLPGGWASGDLGEAAYRFIDLLADAGFAVWQLLPLGQPHGDGSPYQCLSVHAGNRALISIDRLVEWGWLDPVEPSRDPQRHRELLVEARHGFAAHADAGWREARRDFEQAQADWLDEYALFIALREAHGGQAWMAWPTPLRDREPAALAAARTRWAEAIEQVRFEQFVLFTQWARLRDHAHQRGVALFGDMPIFVAHDSVDVWADRDYFAIDAEGRADKVAGVPPDYFSATGQRWGNPHYHWPRMQADGFDWWIKRLEGQLRFFDLIRIDHFRGFEAYWEIPGEHETAMHGHWVKAPGVELFDTLHRHFDPLPLVAEDLGVITDEVVALRDRYQLPGMKILQFAFDGGPDNPYLPHNHVPNSVVYSGTHDNDTTLGWFHGLDEAQKAQILDYLGQPSEAMPWPLVRAAFASVACLAVVPLQDLLELDGQHRMNVPGTSEGNWSWRFDWPQIPDHFVAHLRHLLQLYGRA